MICRLPEVWICWRGSDPVSHFLANFDSPETCCSWIHAISPILGASSTQKLAVGVMEKEFNAMSPARGASSAQKLAAVVLEGELDAKSPDLGVSSTQSPFGCETLVVVSEDVGASSALLLVGWEKPVTVFSCSGTRLQSNLVILTVGNQASISRTLCQAPTRQAFGRQRSPHWYSLWSRTTCTPPGKDETMKTQRRQVKASKHAEREAKCKCPADFARQGDQHRRAVRWLHSVWDFPCWRNPQAPEVTVRRI